MRVPIVSRLRAVRGTSRPATAFVQRSWVLWPLSLRPLVGVPGHGAARAVDAGAGDDPDEAGLRELLADLVDGVDDGHVGRDDADGLALGLQSVAEARRREVAGDGRVEGWVH